MKILITGGSGMLGGNLNEILNPDHEILTIFYSSKGNCNNYNSLKLDISDIQQLKNIVVSFNPEIVIHTAAISDHASADRISPKLVNDINIVSTQNLALLCKNLGSKLIYTSTDLVYAGYRGTMLPEDSKLVPISLYAETKLMGEFKIQQTFDNYLILRMALMFGLGESYQGNHFNDIYEKLLDGKPVYLFKDQFRTPISFYDAAKIIAGLIEKDISGEIINVGGKDKLSRYQMGEILCEEIGIDKEFLFPNSMEDIEGIYKVADVSMNTDKLNSFGILQHNFRTSVQKEIKRVNQ